MIALALLSAALLQAPDTTRARLLAALSEARYARAESLANAADRQAFRGEAQLGQGKWTEAAESFRRALAAGEPDSLTAIFGQARLAELHGRRDSARTGYARLIASYNRATRRLGARDLVAVGGALDRLALVEPQRSREALNVYDLAGRLDPTDAEAPLRGAELLLSRYNAAESRDGFNAILRRWPGQPRALLGIGQVRRFIGDGDPVAPAESALARNPSLVPAHTFLARLALETDDWAGAAAHADSAIALDRHARDAWAIRAALAVVRGDSVAFDAADRAVRADDPGAAEHLAASADAAARARRYHDAAEIALRAVARDSTSWRGWALLGANRLRLGEMTAGRAALERAFAGDPFDLWTKNTLDLLDTLDHYPVTAGRRFRFAIDGKESALLTLYFAPLAEEAYDRLSARYGITPATPVRVEVFPSHADFSVRTVGLAGIGALGVCFGPVIAMDSPSSRDRGQFNWGSTLWHETAHTFHLALSRSRVPRWLTEGLAVREERRAYPGWGAEVNPAFLAAWQAGRLPTFSRLNDGFIRPGDEQTLIHSYTLASYAAEYLESFGDSVPTQMLRAYGAGLDTRSVVDSVLHISLDSADAGFAAWFRDRFAPRLAVLADSSFGNAMRAAITALRAGQREPARAALLRAQAAFPEYSGPDAPARLLARIAAESNDRAGAAAWLDTVLAHDETAYDAALELAAIREALGQPQQAAQALERALFVSPLDPSVHERLATLNEQLGNRAGVVRERRAAIALAPIDRAGSWYRLALALRANGDTAEARRAVVRALENAPGYPDAQELLLDLVDARP